MQNLVAIPIPELSAQRRINAIALRCLGLYNDTSNLQVRSLRLMNQHPTFVVFKEVIID